MSSSEGSIGSSSSGAIAVAFLFDAMIVRVEVRQSGTRYTEAEVRLLGV